MANLAPLPARTALCGASVSVALVWVAACGLGGGDRLSPDVRCDADTICGEGQSCILGRCTPAGHLALGEHCGLETDCDVGLSCRDGSCVPGCVDLFGVGDCPSGEFCRPVAGAGVRQDGSPPDFFGTCAPSECDAAASDEPEEATGCQAGELCAAVGRTVGACVRACDYGFASALYSDRCIDTPAQDFACQPLGLNQAPVCLPADPAASVGLGEPGCHPLRAPCVASQACIEVVCRQLCKPNQDNACGPGGVCAADRGRDDLYYCRLR